MPARLDAVEAPLPDLRCPKLLRGGFSDCEEGEGAMELRRRRGWDWDGVEAPGEAVLAVEAVTRFLVGEGDRGGALLKEANDAEDAGRGGYFRLPVSDRRLEGRPGVVLGVRHWLWRVGLGVEIRRPVVRDGPWFRFREGWREEPDRRPAFLEPPDPGSLITTQFRPSSVECSICLRLTAGPVGVDAPLYGRASPGGPVKYP